MTWYSSHRTKSPTTNDCQCAQFVAKAVVYMPVPGKIAAG